MVLQPFALAVLVTSLGARGGDAPTCADVAALLQGALEHHATVHVLGPAQVERARAVALARFKDDTPWLPEADLAQAQRLLAGDGAALAQEWNGADCTRFEQLAALREAALARATSLVDAAFSACAAVSEGVEADACARMASEADRATTDFAQWAPPAEARRFTRLRIERVLARLREAQPSWGPVTMLKALVGSLDAHSAFLTEDEREEREESWGPGKRLYGVMMRGRGLTPWGMLLDAPTPGSSAALNGLAAGQVLLSVAGTSTVGLAMAEVSALYLPTEATVRLEVGTLRNRRVVSRRVVTLRRGAVVDEPHRVTTKLDRVDGVRVLTVTFASFFSGLAGQVERALTHAKADVVVLDLRGNGGGLVDEALRVADLFCADDVFLLTRGPQGLRRWTSPGLPQAWSGPVVVAVGEGTASASELLAGTLQAKGRALLVGGPHTWGKGTMQEPLHARLDLSWGELVVTTAQTFLLDGRSPQCAGLALDLPLGPAPAQPHNECDAAGSLAAAEVDSLLSEEDQARRVDVMFYDAMLADAGSVLNVAAGLVRAQRELQDPVSTR